MKITIDGARTPGSKLALCSCGWRGTTVSELVAAWEQARRHELACHIGSVAAARGLDAARLRARAALAGAK